MDPMGFVFIFFQINPENFLAFRKVSVVKFAAQVKWSTGLPETAAFFPVGLGLGTSPKTDMDTQNGGLEKVDSFEIWPFLVSMLDFWGVYFGTTPTQDSSHHQNYAISRRGFLTKTFICDCQLLGGR